MSKSVKSDRTHCIVCGESIPRDTVLCEKCIALAVPVMWFENRAYSNGRLERMEAQIKRGQRPQIYPNARQNPAK